MNNEEFITMVREHKNPEKIAAMENYMRNQFQFLGLQAVERRQLAKKFLKAKQAKTKDLFQNEAPGVSIIDWDMLLLFWELPEREFQLIGLDYLKRVEKYLVLPDLANLRTLVLTKSWWDTIDFLAKNIGSLILKEPTLVAEMKKWSVEENIWLRRVAILHQLAFKEWTNTPLLQEVILHSIVDDEFFIRKAIG